MNSVRPKGRKLLWDLGSPNDDTTMTVPIRDAARSSGHGKAAMDLVDYTGGMIVQTTKKNH
jgi:hypothetical protein